MRRPITPWRRRTALLAGLTALLALLLAVDYGLLLAFRALEP